MKKNFKKILGFSIIFCIFVILKIIGAEDWIQQGSVEVSQSWAPLIPLAFSAIGAVKGISQQNQAKALEAQNARPEYKTNTRLVENQAIARQMSKAGLPDQVYNNQLNQIQQSMATGLRQLGSRTSNPINVNALVRSANQAVGNLNAQDAQARMQWTQQLMGANTALANDDRYAFQTNQLNPYLQNANNIASLRRAGNQNFFGSLGMAAQTLAMGGTEGLNSGTPSQKTLTSLQNYRATPIAPNNSLTNMYSNPLYGTVRGMYS